MRKSLRQSSKSHVVNSHRPGGLPAVEEMESRVLLSATPINPIWNSEFSTPTGTQIGLGEDADAREGSNQYAALAPNGDIIVAYAVGVSDSSEFTHTGDIVVAAFKSNGSGGLELDAGFGGFSNDLTSTNGSTTGITAPTGYSVIDLQAAAAASSSDFPQSIFASEVPLGVAVEPDGNIDVIWQTEGGPAPDGVFQLSATGSLLGASGLPYGYNAFGITTAEIDGSYDALVSGSISYTPFGPLEGTPNVWAFRSGVLDSSFGGSSNPGQFFSGSSEDGAFTVITANSEGIYVAGAFGEDSPLTVDEISTSGELTWSDNVSVPSIAGEGATWNANAPFGIGLDSAGDVILGGVAGEDGSGAYALIRLTSAGSSTTWGPNHNGQLWVTDSGILPTSMAVDAAGDVLVNDFTTLSDTEESNGTWFSGSTGSEEKLNYPYGELSGSSVAVSPAVAFDSAGDGVLAAAYTAPSASVNTETLATYSHSAIDAAAPAVSSFQVNDGGVQRSMVDSLTVTFNKPVTLATGAITLNLLSQTGGSPTPITNFNLNSADGGTTWVLTFTAPSYIGGSLPDGAYEVIVTAADVTSSVGLTMAANQNLTFWRLFGDFEGNGTVNGDDFTDIIAVDGTPTNSSDWYMDYNADGVINEDDFTQFVTRLGDTITIP